METPTYRTSALLQVSLLTAVLSAMTIASIALFLQLPRQMVPLSLSGTMGLAFSAFFLSVAAIQTLAKEERERIVPSRWVLTGPSMLLAAYMFLIVFGVNRLLGLHSWF